MNIRKIVFVISIVISMGLSVTGMVLLLSKGKINEQKQKDYIGEKINSQSDKATVNEPFNIVLLGLDEDGTRSDVIMFLNFSMQDSKLNILSITRDTRVRVRGKIEKINALIGIGGESLVVNAVQQLTGLPVNHYITLNFSGFRKVVNVLEGVTLNVPMDMNYDDPDQNLHIHLEKGIQLLDGSKAEQFVRYRKGNHQGEGYSDGDVGRVSAQQEFLKAFFEQKARLKYLSKAKEIFLILKTYMKTNIEVGDLNLFSLNLKKLQETQINSYTLPGSSAVINDLWFYIYDQEKTKSLINDHFFK